jgi:hypothetical protein
MHLFIQDRLRNINKLYHDSQFLVLEIRLSFELDIVSELGIRFNLQTALLSIGKVI